MWPKMLLELLPHLTRLVPLADRYLTSRSVDDQAHAAAVAALGEEMRSGLGRVDEIHAGLQQALKEQGEQIAEAGMEATRARMAAEQVEQRVAKLERRAKATLMVAEAGFILLVATVVMLIVVLVRLHAR
ncbi:MAG TPA: hypothetical protein VG714_10265 [Acidobacteriaceae bacterium]|nr:hypothetical protein [Acidobacteriaceae bacterium]